MATVTVIVRTERINKKGLYSIGHPYRGAAVGEAPADPAWDWDEDPNDECDV